MDKGEAKENCDSDKDVARLAANTTDLTQAARPRYVGKRGGELCFVLNYYRSKPNFTKRILSEDSP